MTESPLIQELKAQRMHKDIGRVLAARFGKVPPDLTAAVWANDEAGRPDALVDQAARCASLEAFRACLMGSEGEALDSGGVR